MTVPAPVVLGKGRVAGPPAMFPGVVRDGVDMLVAYSTVADGWPGGRIRVVRSTDGGASWGEPVTVAEPADGEDAALGALGLTRLADGTLLLPYNGVRWTPGQGTEGRRLTLRLVRSTDGGMTWTGGGPIAIELFGPAVYGQMLELDDGTLAWPVWGSRLPGEPWRSALLGSDDRGRTWSVRSTIGYDQQARLTGEYAEQGETGGSAAAADPMATLDPGFRPHDPTDGFSETTVVVLADGRLLAVLRQQGVGGDRTLALFRSESADLGRHWSPCVPLGISGMSPVLWRLPDGRLLLAYRRCAPAGSGIAPGVEARTGDPTGELWSEAVVLPGALDEVLSAEYQCGYPAVVQSDSADEVEVVFYSFGPEGRYLASCRLSAGPTVGQKPLPE